MDKLKTVPIDLSKWSNVVNNDVVKKTIYDKLVAKVNNIGISGLRSNNIRHWKESYWSWSR